MEVTMIVDDELIQGFKCAQEEKTPVKIRGKSSIEPVYTGKEPVVRDFDGIILEVTSNCLVMSLPMDGITAEVWIPFDSIEDYYFFC